MEFHHWHPFALKFPLLAGEEQKTFDASIAAACGNLKPIEYRMVVVDGEEVAEGIDGRNRLVSCEAQHIAPAFVLIELMDEEVQDYILDCNVNRRHMDAATRKGIVAELRAHGQSVRTIASKLHVPRSTVQRDISGVPNGTADASPTEQTTNHLSDTSGVQRTVHGQDDKKHPASKPKVYCAHCQTLMRKSQEPKKNCPMCKEARKTPPKEKKAPKKQDDAAEPMDAFGTVLPKRCRDAYCDPWIQEAIDFLGVTSAEFWQKRLADGMNKRKGRYPHFNSKDFIDGYAMAGNTIDQILEHLKDFRPAGVCPRCGGEGCPECKMSGLVTRKEYTRLKKEKAK